MHRIHRAEHGPWYFNASEAARFTPCSSPGLGTCYLAERSVAGLLETFKGFTLVDEADVNGRVRFFASLRQPLRLADCCAAQASAFGVNGEIHTTTDYGITQRWASAFASCGFAGIRYLVRSDPSMSLVGYAIFDAAGEAPHGRWPKGLSAGIGDELLREAEAYGLKVRPRP